MLKKHTPPLVLVLLFLNGIARAADILPNETANDYFIFQGKKIPLLRKSDQVAVWYKNIESPLASRFQSKWHANRTDNFNSNRDRMEMYSLPSPANELDNIGKKNAELKFADFQIDLRNNPAARDISPVYYDPEFKRTVVCSDRILLRISRPEILQEVLKTYPVDRLRRHIGGYAGGGWRRCAHLIHQSGSHPCPSTGHHADYLRQNWGRHL